MKSTRIFAQVRAIVAVLDRDGTCTERRLSLEPLNLREAAMVAGNVARNGSYGAVAPYEGLMAAMGGQNSGTIPMSMSASESRSIKTGDWLAIQVAQLSESDQNALATLLGERTELFVNAEKLSRADSEEAKVLALKQIAILEKVAKLSGPQFDD